MSDLQFELIPEPPSVDEYRALRALAGLTSKSEAQAEGAIRGSWSFCHIRMPSTGAVVAMGRVIGDGGWYFIIADMATLPDLQRRGLGRQVIEHLLRDIHRRAPEDPYVTLIADPPGRALYERVGFSRLGQDELGMRFSTIS